jgi:hypothetical protein
MTAQQVASLVKEDIMQRRRAMNVARWILFSSRIWSPLISYFGPRTVVFCARGRHLYIKL